MDKNTIIGFILIALLLIGFGYWNQPSKEQIAEQARQDSIALVKKKALEAQQKTTQVASMKVAADTTHTDSLAALMAATPETATLLENKYMALEISNKGGMVNKAVVKNFESLEGEPDVTVFKGEEQMLNIMLSGKKENIITNNLTFFPQEQTDSTLVMAAPVANGGQLFISYLLPQDSHLLHMEIQAQNMDGFFEPNCDKMDIDWREHCRQQEKSFSFENRYTSVTYKEAGGGTDYLNESKEKIDEEIEAPLDWVAYKTQFFSVVLIAENQFAQNALLTSIPEEKEGGYLKQFEAKMKTNFDPTGQKPTKFEMYVGPNNFRLLQKVNHETGFNKDLELQELIYLGWPLIKWINRFFTLYVFDFLKSMNINMGIILILITLLLKIITFPMVKKSYMSSAKMRVLKPKLDEATKEFNKPEDAMQKQQAMMQEYAKYGVSPLGGCLPMLIQMPIWIAMFNFVPNAIELRRESFLWMDDLSTYDPILEWTNNIPLIGDHLSLTCILFCAANVLYSVLTMRQQKDQMVGQQADQMKMMRWMMYLMPVMFFFIFNDYSSGLNFYYFISLFFSAAIMWTLRKTTNDSKLLAQLEEKYRQRKENPNIKQTGFAARLQEMQKRQEELRRQRGY